VIWGIPYFTLFFIAGAAVFIVGALRNISIWLRGADVKDGVSEIISIAKSGSKLRLLLEALFLDVFLKRRVRRQCQWRGVVKAVFVLSYISLLSLARIKAGFIHELEAKPLYEGFFYEPFDDFYFMRELADPNFSFQPIHAIFNFLGDLFAAGIVIFLITAIHRRLSRNMPLKTQVEDAFALGILTLWFFSKFFAEATTILHYGLPAHIGGYWFIGYGLSLALAPLALPWESIYYALWSLSGLALGVLVAYVPFSKLWHMLLAPVTLLVNYATKGRIHYGPIP